MAKATNTEIIDLLGEKFGEQLFDVTEPYGLLTFSTTKDKIITVLSFLKENGKINFNFLTDSALVCTELVFKSYETANNGSGIPFIMENVAGRKMLTANGIARTFESQNKNNKIFDFALFYDGIESKKVSVLQTEKEFIKSIKRGKWHIFIQ